MDTIGTNYVTSASLRCTRFELYTFTSDTITMHQNFVQCVSASQALKKCVQKSRKLQEMALAMFWLLGCSSGVKCKIVRSCDKPQSAWRALRNLDFYLQKVLRIMAFDVILSKFLITACKKGYKFPMLTLAPQISKNKDHWDWLYDRMPVWLL